MNHQPFNALVIAGFLAALFACPGACQSAQLKDETIQAFNQYIRMAESGMDFAPGKAFLWIDRLPEPNRSKAYSDLKQGQIIAQKPRGQDSTLGVPVPGGLIHDWIGVVFVPGVSISQTLVLLQDYDRDQDNYQPEVVKSKLLARSGDEFQVFLRLKRTNVMTVVFNTAYDVHYVAMDGSHAYSRSYSTRIAEVENPDKPQERESVIGDDHGFLWRLYSYWRFYQTDAGTFIECEAISLSRDVPEGLGWIVRPFIENIPVESLRFTLNATRMALMKRTVGLDSSRSSVQN